MTYVPDAKVYTVEVIDGPGMKRVIANLRRWSGNMLRNGARAIALGPRQVGPSSGGAWSTSASPCGRCSWAPPSAYSPPSSTPLSSSRSRSGSCSRGSCCRSGSSASPTRSTGPGPHPLRQSGGERGGEGAPDLLLSTARHGPTAATSRAGRGEGAGGARRRTPSRGRSSSSRSRFSSGSSGRCPTSSRRHNSGVKRSGPGEQSIHRRRDCFQGPEDPAKIAPELTLISSEFRRDPREI